jgi:hypothetical protein
MSAKRALFWLVCLPVRAALAFAVQRRAVPRLAGALALAAVGAAFAALFAFGLRMEAPESSGGGTWWHDFRAVHAGLYLAAAALLHRGSPVAAAALYADVAVGASAPFWARP